MSIETAIYAAIAGDAGVAAIVGVRVYPDVAPQDVAKPYVVWQEISDVPQNGLDGNTGLDNYRVQVTSWALKGIDARTLNAAVQAAMAAATAFKSLVADIRALPFEQDTRLHGVQTDFSVWIRNP